MSKMQDDAGMASGADPFDADFLERIQDIERRQDERRNCPDEYERRLANMPKPRHLARRLEDVACDARDFGDDLDKMATGCACGWGDADLQQFWREPLARAHESARLIVEWLDALRPGADEDSGAAMDRLRQEVQTARDLLPVLPPGATLARWDAATCKAAAASANGIRWAVRDIVLDIAPRLWASPVGVDDKPPARPVGRPRRRDPDADNKAVRAHIRKRRGEGVPIGKLTRDGIAAATGIPKGAVSGTDAWRALAAEKRQEAAPLNDEQRLEDALKRGDHRAAEAIYFRSDDPGHHA